MPRKRRTGRKARNGAKRARKRLFSLERGLFKTLSMGLFAAIFLGFVYIGLTSSIVLFAALAGIAIFLWGAVALPVDRFQAAGEYLWDGSFGEDVHDVWCWITPWRNKDRRGQVTARTLAVLVALFVVAALVGAGLAAFPVAGQSDGNETTDNDTGFTPTQSCDATVRYDEFRTSESVVDRANESGSAEVTKKNTRVRLNESDAFYRVRAENPNSYCVKMTVEISDEILPLADLGEVASINDRTTARWTDVYDFESQSGYTEVTFSVPANATVTLAPSKPSVFLPAWRDSQKREAEGILAGLKDRLPFGEDEPLEKRVYTFNGSEQSSVTVRLDNPDRESERIEDWNAVYRLSPDDDWKPIDTDTEDPVYVRDRGPDRVEFVMNDEDAQVEFRANPTFKDDVVDDVRSYRSSWSDVLDVLPFGATLPAGSMGAIA